MEAVQSVSASERILQVRGADAEVFDIVRVERTGELFRVDSAVPLVLRVTRGIGMSQPRLSWWRRLLRMEPPPRRGLPIYDGDQLMIAGRAQP